MSISYTYKIISVDEAARCMEIVYTSDGRMPMHIGARLPYENETLETVIDMYSPVAYWLEQERAVVVPKIGASGTITSQPIVAPEPMPEETIENNQIEQNK